MQVGCQVDEVVIGAANFGLPEGHDLHDALGAYVGQGIGVEQALDMHHGKHQVRFQAGAGGGLMHQSQQSQALLLVANIGRHAGRHVEQPDLGIKAVLKAVGACDGLLEFGA